MASFLPALTEVLDVENLQRIQDAFSKATGVASLITTPEGRPITKPSNFCRLCGSVIRATEIGRNNCIIADALLGRLNANGPIVERCPTVGLWHGAASIMVGKHHVGNWLIGQVRNDDRDPDAMRAYAREIGADEKEFMDALAEVPVMPQEQFERISEALFLLANQLSQLAYENAQRAELIREKEAAEGRVRAEREKLAVTLDSIGEGVIATDLDLRITVISRIAQELTGWSLEYALQRPIGEVYTSEDESSGAPRATPISTVLRTGKRAVTETRIVLRARDGTKRRIAESVAPITNSTGEVMGAVLVFRDITREEKLKQELQRTAKLESIGVLAGGIAHDFNNLLAGISGNVGLSRLAISRGDNLKAITFLSNAEQAAMRAQGLSMQLLTFSRGGTPVRKPLQLETLLREGTALTSTGSRHRYTAKIPKVWTVEADAGQLAQVFNNLLINAAEAMQEPGEVLIDARNVTIDARHNLPLPSGPYVAVSVQDSGVGIPAANLGRIFDPFFTTKSRGSGLGLSSVFSIVKAHDGHISVDSEVGHGSTFTVYLPARPDLTPAEPSAAPSAAPTRPLRVLVLDDEEVIRSFLLNALGALGHSVTTAEEGNVALGEAREAIATGKAFDLAILDLTIPGGIGGKEIAGSLHSLFPSIRLIASSGYSTDPVIANFIEYGFDAALPKPYVLEDLERTISRLFAEAKSSSQPNAVPPP